MWLGLGLSLGMRYELDYLYHYLYLDYFYHYLYLDFYPYYDYLYYLGLIQILILMLAQTQC